MKFRAEDGRVVMRSTKTTDRTTAMLMAIESEAAAKKARAGELTQAVILKTLGEMMEKTIGEKLAVSSIADFFAEWLAGKARTGKSAATVNRCRPILDGFVKSIGPKRSMASIGSVTATEIGRFRDQQIDEGKSASTADLTVRVLQAVLTSAHRQGLILQNPATAVESLESPHLAPLIRARGPVSATELAAVLRVNRTTIVRALADFGDGLVMMGATRSTRYVLRRQVGNAGSRWPIYSVDESGQARLWAELEALHERHWRILWAGTPPAWADRFANREGLWEGFPFFLSDARPQGFLGRAISAYALNHSKHW